MILIISIYFVLGISIAYTNVKRCIIALDSPEAQKIVADYPEESAELIIIIMLVLEFIITLLFYPFRLLHAYFKSNMII